jgi:hypothetical protein
MKLKLLSVLLAASALASACGDDNDDLNAGPDGQARVRVVHATAGVGDVDVFIDANLLEQDIPYLEATAYEDVGTGDRNLQVRPTGTSVVAVDEEIELNDGLDYTLLVFGNAADTRFELLEDDLDAPGTGNIKVRLIHAAPSAGTVDVYITEPGVDITFETPDLIGVPFASLADYEELPGGEYQIRVATSGTGNVLIDTGTISLDGGNIFTALAVEAEAGGAPYDVVVIDDNT